MKVGVLADTHDKVTITRAAIAVLKAKGAVALFHCGDLLSLSVLELFRDFPSYFVFGNNDQDRPALIKAAAGWNIQPLGDGGLVTLAPWRIAITHGHIPAEVRSLLQAKPDLLLLGHSHQIRNEMQDGTWIINPGALHRAKIKTCALLDLEARTAEFVTPTES